MEVNMYIYVVHHEWTSNNLFVPNDKNFDSKFILYGTIGFKTLIEAQRSSMRVTLNLIKSAKRTGFIRFKIKPIITKVYV